MVRLIVGNKGKGKTTEILQRVNAQIKEAKGSIVYLDKSSKHMYELNNRIRLIDVSRYPIENSEQFVGFICGIISQDHDIESMYLDGFLKCSKAENDDITRTIKELDAVSTKFNIEFVISLSLDKEELDSSLEDMVLVAL
ncbi:MAG: twitching motility protein PilT [Lachnospiraceae bacterium]|nr:twitching motility protein PilT [Lachnospiraceae bacterium]